MPVTPFDKAIIGGLAAAAAAVIARFGFQASAQDTSAITIILTAVVPYVVAHGLVYWKANKGKI